MVGHGFVVTGFCRRVFALFVSFDLWVLLQVSEWLEVVTLLVDCLKRVIYCSHGVGPITALTWALEVGDPHRFASIADAVSYCGLTAALHSSAGKQQRGPLSKQRNAYLQTTLIEAAKLAPRWNPQLAQLHAQQLKRGHADRATLQVARKLVAYLLAVDKNGQPFQVRTPPPRSKAKPRKSREPAVLESAA